jgi:DNA (cytosine-5)-methyltransferase 1
MQSFNDKANPPSSLPLIIDNFAGGGGASTGIEMALGRSPNYAINHDPEALCMHEANHPETVHLCESVWDVDIAETVAGHHVQLAWFSPDCKHFSKAKGGKPVEKNIRGLAWIVLKWAGIAKPDVIVLENVEEFQTWGPLVDNQPCPRRKGMTFKRWITQLRNLGYVVDHRELRASDYGAPTIRKRLFVIARRDGKKIVWPEHTHGPKGNLFLQPYRTAAECIDWSIPCPSIFDRKRPLAEATLRRIARGIQRYVIDAKEPFIVNLTHGGRLESLSEPFNTITGAHRGEKALVTPFITKFRTGSIGSPINEPLHTVTGGGDLKRPAGGSHAMGLVCPTLVQVGYGERDGQAPRVPGLDKPLGTIVGSGKHALIAAFLAQHNGQSIGQTLKDPQTAITGRDKHSLVQAFLIKYFGTDQDPRLDEPLHTVTSKDRFGLVFVHGEPYEIVDIGMRMLTPRELFRAQGFPDSYVIDPSFEGKPLSKTAQIRMCGNSVCPPVAAAIIRAQFGAKTMEKAA